MLNALNETLRWQGPLHGLPLNRPISITRAASISMCCKTCPACTSRSAATRLTPTQSHGSPRRDAPVGCERNPRYREPWTFQCMPGAYDIEAVFDAGAPYMYCLEEEVIVIPPFTECSLKVLP